MASVEQHLSQYRHNRELIPRLPSTHSDWIVTATFYSCVHLIDAVLLKVSDFHSFDHKSRNGALAKVRQLEFIARKYDPLYVLCRQVRYFANPEMWVPREVIDTEIFGRYLYPIENSAFALLGLDYQHSYIELLPV
jgi:hypothetical protein